MKTIQIQSLMELYQSLLGDEYDVQINENRNYVSGKIQVCLYPTRKPYKVSNINSEVIELYIEIWMPVADIERKESILNHVNSAINGLQEGSLISDEETFTYCSTLDFSRPIMAPQVDSGAFSQLVALQGSILFSASDGAMLLNDMQITLSIVEDDQTTTGELRLLSENLNLSSESEVVLLCNETSAGAYNRTQAANKTLRFLLMNDAICKRLVLAAEEIEPFEINQICTLSTTFSKWEETYSQNYIISRLERNGEAGAFSSITLNLMPASSILEEEDE